ncbi:hypothetical protein K490DRAFT_50166 [Saccharata proteae CBS 121410]|uniref:Phospholipid/glycerol acyltransferase domain-containing protein n=1 Tax=Saccharata proteae CBS 121410 TaxID=1314787 RepID=A0A9P4LVE0_9PEZI|nr:hypothetical protein K490DRAFT_50166 [Saccharata proteae CBS 121410]
MTTTTTTTTPSHHPRNTTTSTTTTTTTSTSTTTTTLETLLTIVRAVFLLLPWLLYLLLVDLCLSLLPPLKPLLPTATYNASSHLAYTVWLWIQHIFTSLNNASITITTNQPDNALPRGDSAIVVCNHVAWADFYMIQEVARRCGMLGRCRWFAKRELRWVPFLGWGLWAMDMPLVSRNWTADRAVIERTFRGIVGNKLPVWLISFSESHRYTASLHRAAVDYSTAHSLPVPQHTLLPRPRGFAATVAALRDSHVGHVYDVTIAYSHAGRFMQAPTFWETLRCRDLAGEGWRFWVHVEVRGVEEVEVGREAEWLRGRWVEKGKWLEGVRKSVEGGKGNGVKVE